MKKGLFEPGKGELLASSEGAQKDELTTITSGLDYLAHCIGCRATDMLALFAHRVEGQMVGWVFACPNCAPNVSRLLIEVQFVPGGQPEDAGSHYFLLS